MIHFDCFKTPDCMLNPNNMQNCLYSDTASPPVPIYTVLKIMIRFTFPCHSQSDKNTIARNKNFRNNWHLISKNNDLYIIEVTFDTRRLSHIIQIYLFNFITTHLYFCSKNWRKILNNNSYTDGYLLTNDLHNIKYANIK